MISATAASCYDGGKDKCNSPYVAHSLLDDISYLQESINAVKAENSQAAIVVNMHDYEEYLIQPNEN